MWLTWFGIESILPNNAGTQKLWSTSAESRLQRSGHGSLLGADRHMQLIGGREAVFWIVKFPPELMADDIDVEGGRRHLLILDGKENAGRGEKEDHDNQNGDHRPGQLDLGAAVDLGRLAVIVGITLPVADHHVRPEASATTIKIAPVICITKSDKWWIISAGPEWGSKMLGVW